MTGASPSIAGHVVRVAAVALAGLAVVAAATVYWGFVAAPSLAARPDNPRRIAFEQRIRRGRILDRRGAVLAASGGPEAAADPASPPARQYPVPAAAPVVGFQTWRYGAGGDPRVTYGVGGAEAAYDDALRGDLGMSWRQLIASRVLHRPLAGHDVVLTLDAGLQAQAAELLGAREGAVVVVDVGSGAVRALVSQPTFDPASLDRGAPPPDDPRRPLFNRATQGRYTPGSVWKVVTLAAALEDGLTTLDATVADGDASDTFGGFRVACDNNPDGVTTFDMAHAFGWSCNLTFARLGTALGSARYRAHAERFGLGEAPPFPLPVASGSLSEHAELPPPELASAAFGQGEIVTTPLHLALIAAAVAGDGGLPVPCLLADVPGIRWGRLADERGTWRQPIGAATAAAVRRAMVVAATDGHARPARDAAGIEIGGKTGTAQLGGSQRPHAWFVGFAPADAPRVAVAVLVVNGGEGSAVAAPIGGRVLARAVAADDAASGDRE